MGLFGMVYPIEIEYYPRETLPLLHSLFSPV